MTVQTNIEVVGLKDALKNLNKLEPSLRRGITTEYKSIVAPVIQEAKANIPKLPLSGWQYSWTTKSGFKMLPWDPNKATKLVKAGVSGKKVKEFQGRTSNLAVFFIRWSGMVDTIFDMGRNGIMSRNLSAKWGRPSRVMWPAYEKHKNEVEGAVESLAFEAMRAADRLMKGK
jgi:hypothetical protein